MAITPIPLTPLPPIPKGVVQQAGNITINAVNDKFAFIFPVPKSGTLDKFECRIVTVGDNPNNGLRFSFQNISATSPDPDGTQDQFRDMTGTITTGWKVPGLLTSDGTDGGVKRTVVAGDLLCCVVEFVSFVAGDSVTFAQLTNGGVSIPNNLYVNSAATGTYVPNTSNSPCVALLYDDGTYAQFNFICWPVIAIEEATFNSGSTPDEKGGKFTLPAEMQTVGFWMIADIDSVADVVLYDSVDGVIDTFSLDPDLRSLTATAVFAGYWPGGPHTLTAGATYRIVLKPTSGSNVILNILQLAGAAYRACLPLGTDWQYTNRTNAGAWSDDTTRLPSFGLLIDGVTLTPSGGGGSAAPFIS